MNNDTQAAAIVADADKQIRKLKAEVADLWPKRQDLYIRFEIDYLLGEIRQAEQAIKELR